LPETLAKRHRAKRIGTQGRVFGVHVPELEAELEELEKAKSESAGTEEQDEKRSAFHFRLRENHEL
jgi:hypothetical protein